LINCTEILHEQDIKSSKDYNIYVILLDIPFLEYVQIYVSLLIKCYSCCFILSGGLTWITEDVVAQVNWSVYLCADRATCQHAKPTLSQKVGVTNDDCQIIRPVPIIHILEETTCL